MRKSDWIALLIIALIIVVGLAIYFTFFFYYTCNDLECYRAHQRDCVRTKFISDGVETTWQYLVKGKDSGKCVINVKVVKIKQGTLDKQRLVNKAMDCSVLLGSIVEPETDLAVCHGELKEEMQNIIIQKLHAYIVENLGEIGKELEKAI